MNLFKKLFRKAAPPPTPEPEEAPQAPVLPAAEPCPEPETPAAPAQTAPVLPPPEAADSGAPLPEVPEAPEAPEEEQVIPVLPPEPPVQPAAFRRLELSSKRELVAFGTYVVLAMETTGLVAGRDHILEVAMERYEDGRLIGRFHTLLRQAAPLSPQVTALTGLTDADLEGALPPQEAAGRTADFLGDRPLVLHNAAFVLPFLGTLLGMAGVTGPVPYVDSLRLARRAWPELRTYGLDYLVRRLKIAHQLPHRARGDALCLSALFRLTLTQLGRSGRETKLSGRYQPRPGVIPDPAGPLWQKRVVFAGSLPGGLADAMQLAADAGAMLRETVTAKTDFLVLGPSASASAKARTAGALNAAGKAHITVLDEAAFLRLAGR